MTDHRLADLLNDRAATELVGPPPLATIHRVATRRRRGWIAVGASATAIAVVAGALVVTADDGAGRRTPPAATAPTSLAPTPSSDRPPSGYRWVGEGAAVVAVPETWATNDVRCGTPQSDTAIVDRGVTCAALVPYPADTSAVEVRLMRGDQAVDGVDRDVDGHRGVLGEVECADEVRGVRVCRQTLSLSDLGVAFDAMTSRGEGELSEILGRVAVLDRAVAVPAAQGIAVERQGEADQAYVARLGEVGLAVEVRTVVRRRLTPGFVLGASPEPGTVVEPGSTVVVTAVAEPAGPADEVALAFNTEKDDHYRSLGDGRVRTRPTLRVQVGARLWSYAEGKHHRTFAVAVAGDAVDQDDWRGPTYPNNWVAARPGTSTFELSIEVAGERLVLATVTVVVT